MPAGDQNPGNLSLLKVDILYSILKEEHFHLTAGHYADLLYVTQRLNPEKLGDIAGKLCPIVATNAEEQRIFYKLIGLVDSMTLENVEEFANRKVLTPREIEEEQRLKKEAAEKKKRRVWLLTAAGVFAVLLLAWWFWPRPRVTIFDTRDTFQVTIQKGGALNLDASAFVPLGIDPEKLNISWDFGHGHIIRNFKAGHIYAAAGDSIVKITVTSTYYTIVKGAGTYFVSICNLLKTKPLLSFKTPVKKGENTRIKLVSAQGETAYQWQIDDRTVSSTDSVLSYSFTETGYHNITCTALSEAAGCAGVTDTTIEVLDTAQHYSVAVAGNRILPPVNLVLKSWVPVALWAAALAISLAILFFRQKRKKFVPFEETGFEKKNVYEVPFAVDDLNLIRPGKTLLETINLMRKRSDEDILKLNIPLTLKKTIGNKGLSELVFSARKEFLEYLLLIDISEPEGSFKYIFDFFSRLMARLDVRVSVYHVDRQLNFYSFRSGGRLSPEQIINNHPNAFLIFAGCGDFLLLPIFPLMKDRFSRFFGNWNNKAMIFPTSRNEWGRKEKILSRYFLSGGADEDELLLLMEKIHLAPARQAEPDEHLQAVFPEPDMVSIEDVVRYLGKNSKMIAWFYGTAIYPKLRWEIILVFGDLLTKTYDQLKGTPYNELLKLSRIPWFSKGIMPPQIRLELLKRLDEKDEILLRQELVIMLEKARRSGSGYYYDTELEDQLLVNKFILYVHDPDKHGVYKTEIDRFKRTWEKGQVLDPALRLYLENNTANGWETPIKDSGKTISLKKYFENASDKWAAGRMLRIAAAALTLLLALLSSFFFKSPGNAPPALFSKFYNPSDTQLVKITYQLKEDSHLCAVGNTGFFSDLSGKFKLGSKEFRITYDTAHHVISTEVPRRLLSDSTLSATLTMDSGNPSYVENAIPINPFYTNGTITFKCDTVPKVKPLVFIQYDPKVDIRRLDGLRQGLAAQGYNVLPIEKVAYAGRNDVRYLAPEMQDQADKLSVIASPYLGSTRIKSTYLDWSAEKNTKSYDRKQLEIWISTLPTCQFISLSDLRKNGLGASYKNSVSNNTLAISADSLILKTPGAAGYRILRDRIYACSGTYTLYISGRNNAVTDSVRLSLSANQLTILSGPGKLAGNYQSYTPGADKPFYRILWVNDHSNPGNTPDVKFFTDQNISVDVAPTNNDAYKLLNHNIYALVITDIQRAGNEPCVTNKDEAGLEFVQHLKQYPKPDIFVFSLKASIDKYGPGFINGGIPAANISSDKAAFRKAVLARLSSGNTQIFPQDLCEPKKPDTTKTNGSALIDRPKPLPSIQYDTIDTYLSKIGLFGQLFKRANVNIPFKKLNIDLTLNSKPTVSADFHYKITDGKCKDFENYLVVEIGKQGQINSSCGLIALVKVYKIEKGYVYFYILIPKK